MLAAAVALALTAALESVWRETIAKNRAAHEQKLLAESLSGVQYDALVFVPPESMPPPPSSVIELWRAADGGRTVAAAVRAETQGYGGAIVFIAGFGEDGAVVQTRIVRHRETPGIAGFLSAPDGGARAIDGVSGATITSAAVASAVREIGEWIRYNRKKIFGKNGGVS